MLKKIRKNYKRLTAFLLSATMIITNVGGNAGTVFAAEEREREEREISIFMVDGQEVLKAVQGTEDQEAFSKEELEEMELEGRKGIVKKYEKLLMPKEGKVYELELDIDTNMVIEGTALQVFYNEKTKKVIFLYLNESDQTVDCCVNIDGYETKVVTVGAKDTDVSEETEGFVPEEGEEEAPGGSHTGGSGGGGGNGGESSKIDETLDGGEGSTSEDAASGSEDSGDSPEDEEKAESDKKETEASKSEDGSTDKNTNKENSDKETSDKDSSEKPGDSDSGNVSSGKPGDSDSGNVSSGKPEDSGSSSDSSQKGDSVKGENTDRDSSGSDEKDVGGSKEETSKKDGADKSDKVDADTTSKEDSGKENDKTSGTAEKRENSAEKSDHTSSREESNQKADDNDSKSSDSHGESLSMSIHRAVIVAVPKDEINGEGGEEPGRETNAPEESEEETTAVEEKAALVEIEEAAAAGENEEKSTFAEESGEKAEGETGEQLEETAESETETAAEAEEIEDEKESETETTGEALEPTEETTEETSEKTEETSAEVTEAEDESEPEESTEAEEPENGDRGAFDNLENGSQEITDDWEIPGKVYDTVTIQKTINARAYCVALEDVQKVVEANQEVEEIESDTIPAKTYTAETDDAEFTVNVPDGAFEEEVELNVVKIEEREQLEQLAEQADTATSQDKAVSGILAYDITFISVEDGSEVEPLQTVEVSIRLKNTAAPESVAEKEATEISVVHLPEDDEPKVVAETQDIQETEFEFQAESFSYYVVTYTVDAAARTDENSFATLQDAINKVKDGATIYLLDDVKENIKSQNKSYILDMQNHTVDGNSKSGVFSFTGTSKVILKNGKITKGKASQGAGISVTGSSSNMISLELDNIIICENITSGMSGTSALYAKYANLNVKNCTIEENTSSSLRNPTKTVYVERSISEFIGGEIRNNNSGTCGGIYQNGGEVTIDGTAIKNNTAHKDDNKYAAGGYSLQLLSKSIFTMKSGAIYDNKCAGSSLDIRFYAQNRVSPVTINIIPANEMSEGAAGNAYFSGYNYQWKETGVSDGIKSVISNTEDGIKGDKVQILSNSKAIYSAERDPNAVPRHVAQVGENKYLSLKSAVESVEDGAQIDLLPNEENPQMPVSDAGNIEVNKRITLNLNGVSVTSKSKDLFHVTENGELKLTNQTKARNAAQNSTVINGNIELAGGKLEVGEGIEISDPIIHGGEQLLIKGKQDDLKISLKQGKYITVDETFEPGNFHITLDESVIHRLLEEGIAMDDVILFEKVSQDMVQPLLEKIRIEGLGSKPYVKIKADGENNIVLHKLDEPNVYLDGINGKDDNSGLESSEPVKTFKKAAEILEDNSTLKTIYILGTVTVEDRETWKLPEGKEVKRFSSYKDTLVQVNANATLTLKDIIIDGYGKLDAGSNVEPGEAVTESSGPLISVATGGTLTVGKGAVLQNNKMVGASDGDKGQKDGGAIYTSGKLCIDGGRIQYNEASGNGGAIYANAGSIEINSGYIQYNTALKNGGAIYARGDVTVKGGSISNNTAKGGGGGGAICINNSSELTIKAVSNECPEFLNNMAYGTGGAISLYGNATGEIVRAKFTGNSSRRPDYGTAYVGGGVIYIHKGSSMKMKNLYVANNNQKKDEKTGKALAGGAGIFTCETGKTAIFELNGALVTDNNILDANGASKRADVSFRGKANGTNSVAYVSDYVLGGAEANWKYVEDNTEATGMWGVEGSFTIKSNVGDTVKEEAKKIAKAEGILMENNTSYSYGNAIANNGSLTIGTEEQTLTVKKEWEPKEGETKPKEILVYLMRAERDAESGEFGTPYQYKGRKDSYVILNEENHWSYTWEHLYRSEEGNVQWSVAEAAVNGYILEEKRERSSLWQNGISKNEIITLTNKPDPDAKTAALKVTKKLPSNPDAKESFDFIVSLTGNDVTGPFAYRIIDKEGNPGKLQPIYDNLSAIQINLKAGESFIIEGIPVGTKYTVTEKSGDYLAYIDGKISEGAKAEGNIAADTGNSLEVIYTNVEKTQVKVKKVWSDEEDNDGVRPKEITVQLSDSAGESEGTPERTLVLNEKNAWSGTFDNLPKCDAEGNPIIWTVKELDVGNNYRSEITKDEENSDNQGNGFIITNTRPVETVTITGEKIWDDANNQDGKRPESITVKLYADGKEIKSNEVVPDAAGNWNWKFEELPKYHNHGELIAYKFIEVLEDGSEYKPDITDPSKENGYAGKIVNRLAPGLIDWTVFKAWEDENNQDGFRPESITVQLKANGSDARKPITLSPENNWSYTWKDLNEYDKGEKIQYTVEEVSKADKYTVESITNEFLEGTKTGISTITNTHTPELTIVKAVKKWDDQNNQDGLRPNSVEVQLMADGASAGTPVMLNEGNNWAYEWKNLPMYQGGNLIEYTVAENTKLDLYSVSYSYDKDGDSSVLVTITNRHKPEENTPKDPEPETPPKNPTSPGNPSGGGGRRERIPVPPERVPLANIDQEDVPLGMIPRDIFEDLTVIDDGSIPLFGIPKMGDGSVSTGALIGMMIFSLMAACGIHVKRRKEQG